MKVRTAAGLTGASMPLGIILASVLVQGVAAPAVAQQISAQYAMPAMRDNDDAPLRNSGGIGGASGYPGRGLQLGVGIVSRYESNLARLATTASGYRVRPQIDARYGIGLGQQGLYVEGLLARDMFFGAPNLFHRNRYQAGAGLDYRLSRCSGQLGGSWQRSLVFQSEAVAFGAFEQESTRLGLNANCRISGALSLDGSVAKQAFKTEVGLGNAFNVDTMSYSLGVSLGSAGLGQFSLSGSSSDSQMPGRLVITGAGLVEDSLIQRNVRLGYSRKFGSKINLGLGVSYINSQPGTDDQILVVDGVPQIVNRDGFKGAGFDALLDINLSPRFDIQFTANRSTFANPNVGAQFSLATNYSAVINYRLNQRYSVAIGASRRENRFLGGFSSALDPFVRVSDTLDRFYGQIGTRLGKRLRLTFDVAHNRRNSNPAFLNFSSTGAGLNLGVQLGRGQR